MSEEVTLHYGKWVYGKASASIVWTEEEFDRRIKENEEYTRDLMVIRDHVRNSDMAEAVKAYNASSKDEPDLPAFIVGYMAAKKEMGESD